VRPSAALLRISLIVAVAAGLGLAAVPVLAASPGSFAGPLGTISTVASTIPANGDVNPYGVAIVPVTAGRLVAGDVLVSNFNNRNNLQGTGSTIVEISPKGRVTVFAHLVPDHLGGACPGGVGLTTALVSLRSGWVIVGSLPTSDGTSATMQPGCLIVVNRWGQAVETISGAPLNGPWDMTALDRSSSALLFVTNVLNGTQEASPASVDGGTVVRIAISTAGDAPLVTSETVIGRGFLERTDPAALVVGPTGVGLGRDGTLYVADTDSNRIAAIPDAISRTTSQRGMTVSAGEALDGPLGLAIAPNGDILTVNGINGNLVETTPGGAQVAVMTLDNTPVSGLPNGNGTLFGLAVAAEGSGIYFVDDGSNTLNLLH